MYHPKWGGMKIINERAQKREKCAIKDLKENVAPAYE